MHGQRLFQPASGVGGAAQRPGQQAGPVRVAAHEADQRTVDPTGAGHRLELGEQLGAERPVAQPDRRGRHSPDEHRPQVRPVVAPGAEGYHGVQCSACGGEVVGLTGQGEETGGHRVGV